MKPHQVEGFNFLLSNLVTDNPGGCILAHAPGSGKTFMIISFIQSFMAKYPFARPLVVLPRGILPAWKKEFQRWQVEDIPLYYVKADGRSQQLEVLKQWAAKRSILFLGYGGILYLIIVVITKTPKVGMNRRAFWTLSPILNAKLDLPPCFIIIGLSPCMRGISMNYIKMGVKSRIM